MQKIKKGILTVLLSFALVISGASAFEFITEQTTVKAETVAAHTAHKACGEIGCEIAEHGENISYTKLQASTLKVDEEESTCYAINSSKYYLYEDVTLNKFLKISKAGKGKGSLNLCLNGHTLTFTGKSGIINMDGVALNICDCRGGGKIVKDGSTALSISKGTVNLHNVIIENKSTNSVINQKGGILHIYGGQIIGGGGGVYFSYGGECYLHGNVRFETQKENVKIDCEQSKQTGNIFDASQYTGENKLSVLLKGELLESESNVVATGDSNRLTLLNEGYILKNDGDKVVYQKDSEPTHEYTKLNFDNEKHWYECVCGCEGKTDEELHKGGQATCTSLAKCEICEVEYGEYAEHLFDQEKTSETGHWTECTCGAEQPESKELHKGGQTTCTSLAKCEVCEVEYGEYAEHLFDQEKTNETEHWTECTCGAEQPESRALHNGGQETCTSLAKCEICEVEYGEYAEHLFDQEKTSATEHWTECTCGAEQVESRELHKGGQATCTRLAKCEVCEMEYGTYELHRWKAGMDGDESEHWKTCLGCGQKREQAKHEYVAWSDWAEKENGIMSKETFCACGKKLTISQYATQKSECQGLEEESALLGVALEYKIEEGIEADSVECQQIEEKAEEKQLAFFDIEIVNTKTQETIADTNGVMTLAIAFDFTDKMDVEFYRNHNGEVVKFTQLAEKPALGQERDGQFFIDEQNHMLYAYSKRFSLYAVAYTQILPKTEDVTEGGKVDAIENKNEKGEELAPFVYGGVGVLAFAGIAIAIRKRKE